MRRFLSTRWRGITIFVVLLSAGWLSLNYYVNHVIMAPVWCNGFLKQQGMAMHNYHDEHGHFPPAFTVDKNGNRLHSWRTLLLPYLGRETLYEQIDLTKPWDHPANASVREGPAPVVFQCPSLSLPPGMTTYKVLVGEDVTFTKSGTPRRFDDFLDGSSNTILIIETSVNDAVHWMDPKDDDAMEFLEGLHDSAFPHQEKVHAALADGSVRSIPRDADRRWLKALTTPDGGENHAF